MRKILLVLLIAIPSLFGFDFGQKIAVISNVNDKTCEIFANNLKVGQSGIIVHNYSAQTSYILAKAVITEVKDNKAIAKIIYEDSLKQDALPTIERKVSGGDLIYLNHLYHNMVIIAPNFEAYDKAKKELWGANLINPDILGAHLKITATPVPKQKDLQDFLLAQHIGIVVFIYKQKAHIVDAQSFKVLETFDVTYETKEQFSPFFTNIEEIKRSLYDFGDKSIKEFDKHYETILKEAK